MRAPHAFLLLMMTGSAIAPAQARITSAVPAVTSGAPGINPYQQRREMLRRSGEKRTTSPAPDHPGHRPPALQASRAPLQVQIPSLPAQHAASDKMRELPVRVLEVQLSPRAPDPIKPQPLLSTATPEHDPSPPLHMQNAALPPSPTAMQDAPPLTPAIELPAVAAAAPEPAPVAVPAPSAASQPPIEENTETVATVLAAAPQTGAAPAQTTLPVSLSSLAAPLVWLASRIEPARDETSLALAEPVQEESVVSEVQPEVEATVETESAENSAAAVEIAPSTDRFAESPTAEAAPLSEAAVEAPGETEIAETATAAEPVPATPSVGEEHAAATEEIPAPYVPGAAEAPPEQDFVQAAETTPVTEKLLDVALAKPEEEEVETQATEAPQETEPQPSSTAEHTENQRQVITSKEPIIIRKPLEAEVTALPAPVTSEPAQFAALVPAAGEHTPPSLPGDITAPQADQASESEPELSRESRRILSRIPPEAGAPEQRLNEGPRNIRINREQAVTDVFTPKPGTEVKRSHEAIGIKIDVRKPAFDSNYVLEKAYNALISGNASEAAEMYRHVLEENPDNVQALFGLATTYQRAGQLEKARPLYGRLLAINPNHVGGLNNFMALIADEAPTQALEELKKLQQSSPDFSPIPAQMAVIYQKTGEWGNATRAILQAIALAPENLAYRYNLAVLLDRQGKHGDAAGIYQQLVEAYMQGAEVRNIRQIQERLTFLRSNKH